MVLLKFPHDVVNIQSAALGLTHCFVKSFLESSTGQWTVLQEELMNRNNRTDLAPLAVKMSQKADSSASSPSM